MRLGFFVNGPHRAAGSENSNYPSETSGPLVITQAARTMPAGRCGTCRNTSEPCAWCKQAAQRCDGCGFLQCRHGALCPPVAP